MCTEVAEPPTHTGSDPARARVVRLAVVASASPTGQRIGLACQAGIFAVGR
jgi:hypothetical protein